MISAKKSGDGQRTIEIAGRNLEIIEDLLALIDSVTRVAFKNSDRDRIEFIKDIPYLIFEVQPTISTMELPCRPEDLKKFGGNNT